MESIASLSILRAASETQAIYSFQLDWIVPSPLFAGQTIHAPFVLFESVSVESGLQNELQQRIDAAMEVLRLLDHKASGHGPSDEALADLGKLLYARLLPRGIQRALESLPVDVPLLLSTNDRLPWELLHDGRHYLALQRSLGRRLLALNAPRPSALKPEARHRILIIADPRGNLRAAGLEGEALWDMFDVAQEDIETDYLGPTQATLAAVRERLAGGNYDLIHYAGHAAANSLLLADGELTASQIAAELRGQPLVFLNACRSANDDEVGDLSGAFIQGGALAVVGTLWNVDDSGSIDFARWFYSLLFDGLPVGEALRQTRARLHAATPNPLWAHYTLYGDPRLFAFGLERRETRQATVLVARLGGLLPLFSRNTLEAAALLQEEAGARLSAIAGHYGGLPRGPLTNVMAVRFGVPDRREDDVRRAVATAFDMIRALGDFNRHHAAHLAEPLRLQIGISTGPVISARVKTQSGFDFQLSGEIVDVAAGLAAAAAPAEVLLDEPSQRLGGDTFHYEPRGALSLAEGFRDVMAYRVVEGRSEPGDHRRAPTEPAPAAVPFKGRGRELSELQQWWSEARAGLFRFVEIVGPPGMGKTRLVGAFRASVFGSPAGGPSAGDERYRWLSVSCQTHEQDSAYALMAKVVRGLTGIYQADDAGNSLSKLRSAVETAVGSALAGGMERGEELVEEGVALLSQVLGLGYTVPSIATLSPDLRQKKLSAMFQALIRTAAAAPFVVILEDIQWADDASLRVLEESLGRAGRLPVLCLAIHRPDWTPPWAAQPWAGSASARHLTLSELDLDAQRALLVEILGGDPGALAGRILTYTGGNPLFIEEMGRSLVESGGIVRDGDEWRLSGELEGRLPDRLEAVIQARLDRLPASTRETMQLASIIGREFGRQLLSDVQDETAREALDSDLDDLLARNLVEIAGGFYPDVAYAFAHALIRQTAYENVPEARRRPLHRVVGRALERRLVDRPAAINPDLLAHHYFLSDDRARAVEWCLAAGERAADLWDNATALIWFGRARQVLDSFNSQPLSPTGTREGATATHINQWRLKALEGAAGVQWKTGEQAVAEANFLDALALAQADGQFSPDVRARLCYQLVHLYEAKGEYDHAWDALEQGLREVEGDEQLQAGRLFIWRGLIHHRRGQPEDAVAWCRRGIAIAEREGSLRDQAMGHNLLAIIFRVQNRTEEALRAAETSLELYKREGFIPGVERAASNLACVYQDLKDWPQATAYFEESLRLSERTGEVFRLAGAYTNLGEVARLQGDWAAAARWYDQGHELAQRHDLDEIAAISAMNSGAVLLAQGQAAEAWARLDGSRALFESIDSRQYLPEVLRYMAEVKLAQHELDAAGELAQQALEIARETGRESERLELEALQARVRSASTTTE